MNSRNLCKQIGYLAVMFCVFAAAGCGYEPEPTPTPGVSGTVRLDRKSMPSGTIVFENPDAQPSQSKLSIKDGEFSGDVPAGTCRVMIFSGSGEGDNTLPAKWNSESELTAEVKDGQPNTFDFEVTSR